MISYKPFTMNRWFFEYYMENIQGITMPLNLMYPIEFRIRMLGETFHALANFNDVSLVEILLENQNRRYDQTAIQETFLTTITKYST